MSSIYEFSTCYSNPSKYEPLLSALIDLQYKTESPFGAFGQENAGALMEILDFDPAVLEADAGTVEGLKVIDEVVQPTVRLENHWRALDEAWHKVSHIPMNPPVLEHRGSVLDKYGRMTPDFVKRMFKQQDVEAGDRSIQKAYSDEERQSYTRLMCEGIAGGMSMTGVDRVEWNFWQEVSARMVGEDKTGIIHVDSGASLGLVPLQIMSDERAGATALAGKVARVVAVDKIPAEQTLTRVYKFDDRAGHYDQTQRLLTVPEAVQVYEEAQATFHQVHPQARFDHVVADTTAGKLPNELEQLAGQVDLVTDMRANWLHGGPEERAKAHETFKRLVGTKEGARVYEQRGLPIYGDLVLGALYKVVNGNLVVEALQLNDKGHSKTIWRLDKDGQPSPTWEEELKEVFTE